MEPASALQPLNRHAIVHDQKSRQNRGDREAFRRALLEQDEAEATQQGAEETPVRRELQPKPQARRQEQGARHVDVLA
jgi:hypothetical protein